MLDGMPDAMPDALPDSESDAMHVRTDVRTNALTKSLQPPRDILTFRYARAHIRLIPSSTDQEEAS